ncbi:MAG TPA: creatininase family protein [Candidatus Acidoferrum sp.]|nr:creatininase family protein [Candidatus Acidoferrum sp.]
MTGKVSRKVRLSELTAVEAREILAKNPVILLPLGSHEDQGPHAPMGDYLLAEHVADQIAERASGRGVETLVAPVIPFGGSNYFGSTPGGIALTQTTLRALLIDVLGCLLRHNLSHLIILNGHDGNVQCIQEVTSEIYRSSGCLIPNIYLWRVAQSLLAEVVGEEKAKRTSGHGADVLTSLAMHFFPERVRWDLIPAPADRLEVMGLPVTGLATVGFEGVNISVPLEVADLAPNGVAGGDPRLCSPETGAALAEKLVELGARFVRHYADQSTRSDRKAAV